MLEIIALIFLTKNIGEIAAQKGLKPGTWKLYTVLGWVASEVAGVIVGLMVFGQRSLIPAALLGLGCALTCFFIIRANLNKRPDVDDDIDQIGVKDLYP